MSMGLKIHRMMKEDNKDPPELKEEADRRREMSDSILEIIYNRLVHKKSEKKDLIEDDEEDDWK